MTASIIPFQRDLMKTVDRLVDLRPGMGGEELLARHNRIGRARVEAYALNGQGRMSMEQVHRITLCSENFHKIAQRAGVSASTIAAFNAAREDWKGWAAYRATIPENRRL